MRRLALTAACLALAWQAAAATRPFGSLAKLPTGGVVAAGKVVVTPEPPFPAAAGLVVGADQEYTITNGVVTCSGGCTLAAPMNIRVAVYLKVSATGNARVDYRQVVPTFRTSVSDATDAEITLEDLYEAANGTVTVDAAVLREADSVLLLAPGGGTDDQVLSQSAGELVWADAAAGGTGDIEGVTAGDGLTGGGTTGTVSLAVGAGTGMSVSADAIGLANTAVSAGSYTLSAITVDAQGRITSAASGTETGDISGVTAGTGLSGGGSSGAVTLDIANTAVTPGSYTYTALTVDQQGRITSASSGAAPAAEADTLGTVTGRGASTTTAITLGGSSPLILDGSTAGTHATTITVTDPSAANVLTLPNATGTVALTSDIPAEADTLATVTARGATTTNAVTVNLDSIGSSQTNGVSLTNTTDSTAGVTVQRSPSIYLTGSAWSSGGGGNTDFSAYVDLLPATASTATSTLRMVNNSQVMSLSSNGFLTVPGSATVNGSSFTSAGSLIYGGGYGSTGATGSSAGNFSMDGTLTVGPAASATTTLSTSTTLADNATEGAFTITTPSNGYCAVHVAYMAATTNSTDYQSHTGQVTFATVNKAGVTTCDESDDVSEAVAVSTGTLITDTWACADTGTSPDTVNFSINGSLDSTITLYMNVQVMGSAGCSVATL